VRHFKQVVHSSKTRDADCDEQSVQSGRPEWTFIRNARLTFIRHEQISQSVLFQRMTLKAAATAFNACARTAARWIRRYQLEGSAGLQDRSSRPHSLSTAYGEALARRVGARLHGFHIAQITGLSRATVSRILLRLGFEPHAQSGAGCAADPLRACCSWRSASPRY
jgi:transposase